MHYLINAKDFKNSDNVPLTGFFEVLAEGTLPLLLKTKIVVKKPDYNEALNVGPRDTKILGNEKLYYAKVDHVFEVPSPKKKILA